MTQDNDAISKIVEELFQKQAKYKTAELNDVTYTEIISIYCKYCGSKNVVKNGSKGDIQYYLCRDCNHTFAGNNALPGMRYPPDRIATALRLFYEGLSLDKIRRELDHLYSVYPSDSTVYEWVTKYTKSAIKEAKYSNIKVGDVWIADETMLKLDKDVHVWFWDIIDDATRFLLGSHISLTRTIKDAQALMENATMRAGKVPRIIYTDKLAAYFDVNIASSGGCVARRRAARNRASNSPMPNGLVR